MLQSSVCFILHIPRMPCTETGTCRNLHENGAEQERQGSEACRSNKGGPFSSSAMLPVPLLVSREGSFHCPWAE